MYEGMTEGVLQEESSPLIAQVGQAQPEYQSAS